MKHLDYADVQKIAKDTIEYIKGEIHPGISLKEVRRLCEEKMLQLGADSFWYWDIGAFVFSGNETTVSVSGREYSTSDRIIQPDDIITIDCGTLLDGFNGDSAYTFCVGPVSDEVKQLLKTTKESLYIGIENAVAGKHIGDIGSAVQDHCEAQGYGIVRELTGHGIGRQMHEDPQVPNYGRRGNGMMLKAGMCIAIEPMITMGDRAIYMDAKDRWTIRTRDGKPAAHFEHTIAVRRGKAEILSSFEEVESIEGILY